MKISMDFHGILGICSDFTGFFVIYLDLFDLSVRISKDF